MEAKCKFADRCPIVKYFSEQDRNIMLNRYCFGNFEKCARYQMRMSGQEVEELMMPWDGFVELEHNGKGVFD